MTKYAKTDVKLEETEVSLYESKITVGDKIFDIEKTVLGTDPIKSNIILVKTLGYNLRIQFYNNSFLIKTWLETYDNSCNHIFTTESNVNLLKFFSAYLSIKYGDSSYEELVGKRPFKWFTEKFTADLKNNDLVVMITDDSQTYKEVLHIVNVEKFEELIFDVYKIITNVKKIGL